MSDEREYSRRDILRMLVAGPVVLASGPILLTAGCAHYEVPPPYAVGDYDPAVHYWAYAVDTTRCIGCLACMRACQTENKVPPGVVRTWVERYRVGYDGQVRVEAPTGAQPVFAPVAGDVAKAFFVPKLCNHCEKSVCNQVCPVGAAYLTRDGLVLVDAQHCIGCGYCVQACPYGSRFINPITHTADKCTFCYHRLVRGLAPACVAACPTQARIYGDLRNPKGKLSTILRQRSFRLLKPEMGTHPKCYYTGLAREVV